METVPWLASPTLTRLSVSPSTSVSLPSSAAGDRVRALSSFSVKLSLLTMGPSLLPVMVIVPIADDVPPLPSSTV